MSGVVINEDDNTHPYLLFNNWGKTLKASNAIKVDPLVGWNEPELAAIKRGDKLGGLLYSLPLQDFIASAS